MIVLLAHRRAITDRLQSPETVAAQQNLDAAQRNRLDELAREVREALDRRWTPA